MDAVFRIIPPAVTWMTKLRPEWRIDVQFGTFKAPKVAFTTFRLDVITTDKQTLPGLHAPIFKMTLSVKLIRIPSI